MAGIHTPEQIDAHYKQKGYKENRKKGFYENEVLHILGKIHPLWNLLESEFSTSIGQKKRKQLN
jgi:hypothetical protein